MNRRRFLRLLGIAPVGVVAAVPVMAPAIVQGRPTVYEIDPGIEVECIRGEMIRADSARIDELVGRALRDNLARHGPSYRAMRRHFGLA